MEIYDRYKALKIVYPDNSYEYVWKPTIERIEQGAGYVGIQTVKDRRGLKEPSIKIMTNTVTYPVLTALTLKERTKELSILIADMVADDQISALMRELADHFLNPEEEEAVDSFLTVTRNELQTKSLFEEILAELKKINTHLSLITDWEGK